MRGRNTLIDSSAWVESLRVDGNPGIRTIVFDLIGDGQAFLCDMVLLELWNGARGTSEHKMLRSMEDELELVQTSEAVWQSAHELARELRRSGATVPASYVLIAACAKHYDLELVHADRHFDTLAQFL